MKVLILIGMLIIFISAFFSFFIFDTVVRGGIKCLYSGEGCGEGTAAPIVLGLAMVAFFIVIDILVVYIITKSIAAGSYSAGPGQGQQAI